MNNNLITFKNTNGDVFNGRIKKTRYANNKRTNLELYSDLEGPIANITVNIDKPLDKDHAFIKDYSENQGIMRQMINQGVLSEPIGYVRSGYVKIPYCKILV